MRKDKTQTMRELRKARTEAGLQRFEVWVYPEHRERVKRYVSKLKRASK